MDKVLAPENLRFENHNVSKTTIGIGESAPRLSWFVPEAPEGFRQSGYEIEISRHGASNVYKVESDEQIYVPWPGHALSSRERAEVRIRVADNDNWSAWSDWYSVEAGLLEPSDWKGEFIEPAVAGKLDGRAPVLVKHFSISKNIACARVYATARGIYTLYLNGKKVGDEHFAPGWTSYHNRLRYQTYDIAGLLENGDNRLEIRLGNGWYRGFLGYENKRALYGDSLSALLQVECTFDDEEVLIVPTDGSWKVYESYILSDDIYNGEHVDFNLTGSENEVLTEVQCVTDLPVPLLVAPDGPPVRELEEIKPTRIWKSPEGKNLVDFGQNIVGKVRLTVRGQKPGTKITIRHAEVLENEELGIRPLRHAKATDSFITGPEEEYTWEPEFTFHGFRFAEVTGTGSLSLKDICAIVLGSDLQQTGWFECSFPLLNKLHKNVIWGMKGNFLDIPTDCPQRDERLGWTGDIQIFGPTANYLYYSAGFLSSWLKDVAIEQHPGGEVPHVVPSVSEQPFTWTPTAAWGDAAVMVPWTIYQRTGDSQILKQQIDSMVAWVECVAKVAGDDYLWTGGFQYGDWLDPTAPPEDPGRAAADPDVVATAHYYKSSQILAEAFNVLGDSEKAEYYTGLASKIKAAFNRRYVTKDGRVLSDAQTVYSLAIEWDLFESAEQKELAGKKLADLVRTGGFRIATGFIGTPIICSALSRCGHVGIAYRLLLQTQCPSWLYPVTMGATTIWERWDSMLPDGTINPGEMTSFNHYALGAVADWMHQNLTGLSLTSPGYKTFRVRPLLNKHFEHARTSHITPYGEISVEWERKNGFFSLHVLVPVHCRAEIFLPGTSESVNVTHGEHNWKVSDPCLQTGALPVNATIRDLIDHEEFWEECCSAAIAAGVVKDDVDAAGRMGKYLDYPVDMVGQAFSPIIHFPGVLDLRRKLVNLLGVYDPDVEANPV